MAAEGRFHKGEGQSSPEQEHHPSKAGRWELLGEWERVGPVPGKAEIKCERTPRYSNSSAVLSHYTHFSI